MENLENERSLVTPVKIRINRDRDLDKIDGKPNPIFRRWLDHPTYDSYWQRMIPYDSDFAKINIPVLQTAGYFFGGPGADVYYFKPTARHLAVVAGHAALLGVSRQAVATLDRLGVKDRLKKAMRLWKSRGETPAAP